MSNYNTVDLYFLGRFYLAIENSFIAPLFESPGCGKPVTINELPLTNLSGALPGTHQKTVQDLTDSLQSTMVELYQLAGEMAPSEQDAIASSNLEGLLVFTRSLLEYLRESVRTLGMNADDTARSDFEKSFGLFSAEFVSEFVAGLELNTHSENFLSTERRKQFAYRLFVTVVPGLLYREDPALDYKIAMELDSSSFESVFTSLNQELRSKLQSAVVCEKTPTEAESILAKYAERLCIGRRMGLQRGSFSH